VGKRPSSSAQSALCCHAPDEGRLTVKYYLDIGRQGSACACALVQQSLSLFAAHLGVCIGQDEADSLSSADLLRETPRLDSSPAKKLDFPLPFRPTMTLCPGLPRQLAFHGTRSGDASSRERLDSHLVSIRLEAYPSAGNTRMGPVIPSSWAPPLSPWMVIVLICCRPSAPASFEKCFVAHHLGKLPERLTMCFLRLSRKI
jgi:hypothetical protein